MPDRPSSGPNDTELVHVLVELRVPGDGGEQAAMARARELAADGFSMDPDCKCMCLPDAAAPGKETYLVTGRIPPGAQSRLEQRLDVVKVWSDGPIAPLREAPAADQAATTPGDCRSVTPCTCKKRYTGTIEQVVSALHADQLWNDGIKGAEIVVGIVDRGITAAGRQIANEDRDNGWTEEHAIPRVIGGFPDDWGTRGAFARKGGSHGNNTARAVLGVAPAVQLLDIRIFDRVTDREPGMGRIIGACQGYGWAIERYRQHGTPHVLSNSWALWRKSWHPEFATDIQHPLNRLVALAVHEGIAVVFGAGNCGNECENFKFPQCDTDTGPGHAIWGAAGHPDVMTVGAATIQGEFIGYSSPGPAALHAEKPDFLAFSHFRSSNPRRSYDGTSAACPLVAGVVALLLSARRQATPKVLKDCLRETARRNGSRGFDIHWGYGIINAKAAYDLLCSYVLP